MYKIQPKTEEDLKRILNRVISMGQQAYEIYQTEYHLMPSCKEYLFQENEKYDDCMIERANTLLEIVIEQTNKRQYNLIL